MERLLKNYPKQVEWMFVHPLYKNLDEEELTDFITTELETIEKLDEFKAEELLGEIFGRSVEVILRNFHKKSGVILNKVEMLVAEALLYACYSEEETIEIMTKKRYIFFVRCENMVDVAINRLMSLGMYWSEAKAVVERIGVEQVAKAMEKQYPCVFAYIGWVRIV